LVEKHLISKARQSTITRLTIFIAWIDEEGKHSKPHRACNKMNYAMTYQTENEHLNKRDTEHTVMNYASTIFSFKQRRYTFDDNKKETHTLRILTVIIEHMNL
jgi:hypothetical protein